MQSGTSRVKGVPCVEEEGRRALPSKAELLQSPALPPHFLPLTCCSSLVRCRKRQDRNLLPHLWIVGPRESPGPS